MIQAQEEQAVASKLTAEGENFAEAVHLLEEEGECAPILVLSLFNGIGGAFRCYDVAGIPVAGRISFDLCKEANRVTSKAWPSALIYHDVKSITPKLVEEWSPAVHYDFRGPCVGRISLRRFEQCERWQTQLGRTAIHALLRNPSSGSALQRRVWTVCGGQEPGGECGQHG